MRLPICVGVAATLMALAQPAAATNWVGDGWFFHDKDSISRSGDIVTVNEADCHGAEEYEDDYGVDQPNARCKYSQTRINCVTGEKRDMTTGQTWMLSSWTATIQLFCPEKRAAAVKPAAPPKPAQPVPAKAQSDLELCRSYKDKKKSIAACTRVIDSANPGIADLASAHEQRCILRYFEKEKPEVAIADCDRAVALAPKSTNAFNARGIMNNAAKRFDAAIADFTAAIALKPKDPRSYGNRANVYLRKKDLQRAIADYTTQQNLTPGASEITFRLMLCWARASLNAELDSALADCESAVKLEPKTSYVYARRALVRLRMGNLKDARADADKALSLDGKDAGALYIRALVNAREGKTMAAADDRSAAVKISDWIANEYDDIGLKMTVQPEAAPFCPAMTSLVKAAGERAASNAKADVALPGATYCTAIDRGYWCGWETGVAAAEAKQKAMATAAAACLAGYTRKDSANAGTSGPASAFTLSKTKVTIGTMYKLRTKAIDAVGVSVVIDK